MVEGSQKGAKKSVGVCNPLPPAKTDPKPGIIGSGQGKEGFCQGKMAHAATLREKVKIEKENSGQRKKVCGTDGKASLNRWTLNRRGGAN